MQANLHPQPRSSRQVQYNQPTHVCIVFQYKVQSSPINHVKVTLGGVWYMHASQQAVNSRAF